MTDSHNYTANELLAVLSARQLKDGQVVFAGIGIPLLASALAQSLHCPGLTMLFDGGVIGAVTDLAVFAFDETTRAMKAISLNPGVTQKQVQDNTGFELQFDRDIGPTAPPTAHELATLRKYDPDKLFTA